MIEEKKKAKIIEVPVQVERYFELDSGEQVDRDEILIRIYNKILSMEDKK